MLESVILSTRIRAELAMRDGLTFIAISCSIEQYNINNGLLTLNLSPDPETGLTNANSKFCLNLLFEFSAPEIDETSTSPLSHQLPTLDFS